MEPRAAKLCGIASNCAMCRHVPEHRRVIGWPDICPRGKTAESIGVRPRPKPKPCGKPGGPKTMKSLRMRDITTRALSTCRDFGGVLASVPCAAGGTRPTMIRCKSRRVKLPEIPAVACAGCKHYTEGGG